MTLSHNFENENFERMPRTKKHKEKRQDKAKSKSKEGKAKKKKRSGNVYGYLVQLPTNWENESHRFEWTGMEFQTNCDNVNGIEQITIDLENESMKPN